MAEWLMAHNNFSTSDRKEFIIGERVGLQRVFAERRMLRIFSVATASVRSRAIKLQWR